MPVRYRTCNSTYEALTELLIGDPNGILIERDELVSLLKYLDREEHAVAEDLLSGWSGLQPYTLDRIGRGQRHVEGVCVSILGNTQPAKIGEYVRRANADGAGGDGLIQNSGCWFGLIIQANGATSIGIPTATRAPRRGAYSTGSESSTLIGRRDRRP